MKELQLKKWGQDFESSLIAISEKRDKSVLGDGTVLIGHMPEIAKYAYTHKLFAAMDTSTILNIENKLNLVLPKSLLNFYSLYNGCSIFGGNICIFGIRETNKRDVETALTRPFDIVSMNLERPEYCKMGQIIVGFYKQDSGLIVMNLGQGIFKINRDTRQIESEWESLFELLDDELRKGSVTKLS